MIENLEKLKIFTSIKSDPRMFLSVLNIRNHDSTPTLPFQKQMVNFKIKLQYILKYQM